MKTTMILFGIVYAIVLVIGIGIACYRFHLLSCQKRKKKTDFK